MYNLCDIKEYQEKILKIKEDNIWLELNMHLELEWSYLLLLYHKLFIWNFIVFEHFH